MELKDYHRRPICCWPKAVNIAADSATQPAANVANTNAVTHNQSTTPQQRTRGYIITILKRIGYHCSDWQGRENATLHRGVLLSRLCVIIGIWTCDLLTPTNPRTFWRDFFSHRGLGNIWRSQRMIWENELMNEWLILLTLSMISMLRMQIGTHYSTGTPPSPKTHFKSCLD